VALSKDVVIRLIGDADSAIKAQKAAADAAEVSVGAYRRAEREHAKLAKAAETAARQQREAYDQLGKGMMVAGAAIAAGLGLSAKAAIDWESAWAGVQKTVDGTPEQMAALEKELRNLATTLPATHEEIAGIAEAAGQLGIARGDIAEFTKVAIAMGVSTNLSADEAATGMARMANIMGTSAKDADRMGSALVAVGNAGASTEGEILDMSLRIAAAGRQAGFSEGEVLGLANAMSSLGIQAEAGGTAISTVIKSINNAVLDGGDSLEGFARVAGMSAESFATAWRDNAASALQTVVAGLARMQGEGKNVNQVINDLGLGGIRTSDTLLRLSGDAEGVADSLALGNRAWAENNALMNEANQRYETTAARLQTARNQITDAAIDIGGLLLPVLAEGAELVADFARGFQELPGPLKDTVTVLGTLAATVGLVGGAAILAVPKIAAFRATMHTLETAGGAAARGVGKLGLVMTGPWGVAIGVGTLLLGGLVTALGASSRASEEAAGYQDRLAEALRDTGGAINETVEELAVAEARSDAWAIGGKSLLEVTEQLAGASGLPKLTEALLGQREEYEELDAAADAYLQRALELANYNTEDASFVAVSETVAAYKENLRELTGQMGGAIAENERTAAALGATGEAADTAATSVSGVASALGLTSDAAPGAEEGIAGVGGAADLTQEQIEAAEKALDDWITSMSKIASSFVNPLGAYKALLDEKTTAERDAAEKTAATRNEEIDKEIEAVRRRSDAEIAGVEGTGAAAEVTRTHMRDQRDATVDSLEDSKVSWEDYVDSVDVSLDELADRLAEQIENQQEWRTNLGIIAQRAGVDVAKHLADMGDDGVEIVAKMADGTDAEVKRMTNLIREDIRLGGEGWSADMGKEMAVLEAIGKKGAKATAHGINTELDIGVDEVARIAAQYGLTLARGIDPVLAALGKPGTAGRMASAQSLARQRGLADGGYTGPGGKYEPAGIVHAGEIVWSQEDIAAHGGVSQVESMRRSRRGYADGGFVSAADVPRPPSTAPYRMPISTGADATMGTGYDEVRRWLRDNLTAPAVTGWDRTGWTVMEDGSWLPPPHLRGMGKGVGNWQQMWATIKSSPVASFARLTSWLRPGDPGMHGRGRAIDIAGSVPYPGGNSRAEMASINRWIASAYPNSTELIYTPGINLYRGRRHTYNAPTRADHWDHVHWAMANGGVIGEPVIGRGLRTGASYSFGERGPETVTPGLPVGRNMAATGPVNVDVQARVFVGNREITDIARVEATAVLSEWDRRAEVNVRSAGTSRY
jgi:TP901 family phage tail tape measure protein